MKNVLILILPLYLLGSSSFITPLENASQLYKNPRGIGCHHCHGDKGEGMVIARYIHKKEKKSLDGPMIKNLDFNDFHKALNKRIQGMPRYFLTKKEVQALYLYLQQEDN